VTQRNEDLITTLAQELRAFVRSTRAEAMAERLHPGLSFAAFTLLLHIEAEEQSRASELAKTYDRDRSTISRQLTELESAGLIERIRDPEDGRAQVLRVSEQGRRRLAEIRSTSMQGLRALFSTWPEEDMAMFAGLLHRFNTQVQQLRRTARA
jgi:DNA-binding MarR family transcriptional regulator